MRELVYDILQEDSDMTIYDSRSVDWNLFTYNSGFDLYKITKDDIYKSYLISVKYYDTIDYDDIILLLNNIEDIFEVVPGTEIKIPKLVDLKNFINLYQK